MLQFNESARLIAESSNYVAAGVNSNFRIGMGPGPLVFKRGEGAYLIDADDNRLIDYYCGMGATVLGHNPAGVLAAVKAQVDNGILFAGQTAIEYEAAKLICDRIPSAERLRFGSSGSEVIQAAMRLVRAATGRRTILKFEGHYHGWFDNILWSTAPSLIDAGGPEQPNRVGGSRGQGPDDGDGLDILGWNDLPALQARLAKGDVAAVLMEPAMCNQGAITPGAGYLEGVQAACRQHGTLLIFDEIITGFRRGRSGAQGRFGMTPDLTVFAKAIANGFPVAAIAGKAELIDLFVTGGVLHGGTFNAQPVAMAAMVATQKLLTPEHYERSSVSGMRLREGVRDALAEAGIVAQVTGFELMFHVAFGLQQPARNYRDLATADKAGYARFAQALLRRGYMLEAMLARGMRDACYAPLWDPLTVHFCFQAGQGARFNLRIGGKATNLSGRPLDLDVVVKTLIPDAHRPSTKTWASIRASSNSSASKASIATTICSSPSVPT